VARHDAPLGQRRHQLVGPAVELGERAVAERRDDRGPVGFEAGEVRDRHAVCHCLRVGLVHLASPELRCEQRDDSYTEPTMSRSLIERRLTDVTERLKRARQELAVLDEQLAALSDAADDARIRALVSETPLADK